MAKVWTGIFAVPVFLTFISNRIWRGNTIKCLTRASSDLCTPLWQLHHIFVFS